MPSRIRSLSGPRSAGLTALLSAAVLAAALAAAQQAPAATPAGGKPRIGDRAPGFRLEGLGKSRAEAVSLEALAGQVVLIDFWASWCAPCKRTLPELARLGARHPGLKVLAVSLDEDRSKALGFLKGQDKGLLALHDAGFEESVAVMGTAMTEQQATELARMAPKVYLALDADASGRRAALRAAEVLGAHRDTETLVIQIPQGKDPDELIKTGGAEAFEEAISRAVPSPSSMPSRCAERTMIASSASVS